MRRARVSDQFDLVVIGLGSAGLAAARFAAHIGKRVAVVERDRPGGDCLWTGCVPSKTLLASARSAQHARTAPALGVHVGEPTADADAVWTRIRDVQREIAEGDDSPQALTKLGLEVVTGSARLQSATTVDVDGRQVTTRFTLICTGSRPAVPAIPGLVESGYLTSDTVWNLTTIPRRLVVIGAGSIGCELGQAMQRLGSQVTIIESAPRILSAEEPDLAASLAHHLTGEGVEIAVGVVIERVELVDGTRVVHGRVGGEPVRWSADDLLVATGRVANVDDLGLSEVGIATTPAGIAVDSRLRTVRASVFAAGDVTGRPRFTHVAAHDATVAVRNMFFPGSTEAATLVPRCTFTDPELANVGMTINEARARHGAAAVAVHRSDLTRSDRGRADGLQTGGMVLVTVKGRLVGASVLAPAAGEIVHSLALAISQRLRLRDLSALVHVYPTLTWEVALLAAQASYDRARRWRFLSRFVGR